MQASQMGSHQFFHFLNEFNLHMRLQILEEYKYFF